MRAKATAKRLFQLRLGVQHLPALAGKNCLLSSLYACLHLPVLPASLSAGPAVHACAASPGCGYLVGRRATGWFAGWTFVENGRRLTSISTAAATALYLPAACRRLPPSSFWPGARACFALRRRFGRC